MKRRVRIAVAAAIFSTAAGWAAYEGSKLGYDGLIALIKDKGISSVDQLVAELDKKDPKFVESAVLMKKSGSVQKGSIKEPRVLLTNDDGSLIISFSGASDKRAGQKIEIISQTGDAAPRFAEVDFEQPKPLFRDGHGGHAEAPADCASCHAGGYIWEPYPFWPGAMIEHEDATPDEIKDLKTFFETQAKEGSRYDVIKKAIDRQRPFFKDEQPQQSIDRYRTKPLSSNNIKITRVLGEQSYANLARELKALPEYNRFKFAIVGAALHCKDLEGFFPEPYRRNRTGLSEMVEQTTQLIDRHFKDNVKRSLHGGKGLDSDKQNVDHSTSAITGGMRYVLEGMMGYNLERWSFSTTRNSYAFWEGYYGLTRVGDHLRASVGMPAVKNYMDHVEQLAKKDTSILEDGFGGVFPPLERSECKTLRRKSLAALTAIGATPGLTGDDDLPTVLHVLRPESFEPALDQLHSAKPKVATADTKAHGSPRSCIHCHAIEPTTGPYIPFDDEVALKESLGLKDSQGRSFLEAILYRMTLGESNRSSMPRGQINTSGEVTDIVRFSGYLLALRPDLKVDPVLLKAFQKKYNDLSRARGFQPPLYPEAMSGASVLH